MITAELINEGILPRLDRVLVIWTEGALPVLFFGLAEGHAATPLLRDIGWKGAPVELLRLPRQHVTRLVNAIDALLGTDGKAASRWLRRKKGRRLLVFMNKATLCLNFDEKTGFVLEPGT